MIFVIAAINLTMPPRCEYVPRVVFVETVIHEPKANVGEASTSRYKRVEIHRKDWFGQWHAKAYDVDEFPMVDRQGPYRRLRINDRHYKTRQVIEYSETFRAPGMEHVK